MELEPVELEPVLPEFMLPVEEPLCEPTEPLCEPVLEDASGVVLLPVEDEGEVLLDAELPV